MVVSTGAALKIGVQVLQGWMDGRFTREESLGGKYAEWKLALPIAVTGASRPQVLAELYRPNWLDFKIFDIAGDVEDGNIVQIFTFSCRDDQAIRWHTERGRLASFDTIDRYAHPSASLERKVRRGTRWELVPTYRFVSRKNDWVAVRKAWRKYRFGVAAEGQAIAGPGDCRFLFRGSS
jgi:hypothetical protein